MKIGIDFDNTIAKYDELFVHVAALECMIDGTREDYDKVHLRDYLRSQKNGEQIWMKLQGLVYGRYMAKAEMMPGFSRFIFRCKYYGHKIYIVSHKTKYGHFDAEKVSLRSEALKWMYNRRFFDASYFDICEDDVYFADTRKEKIKQISNLGCDYFIDDLPELFIEDSFPKSIHKILFCNNGAEIDNLNVDITSDWQGISHYMFGNIIQEEIQQWFVLSMDVDLISVNKIHRGGNSNVFHVISNEGNEYAVKAYSSRLCDQRYRLATEYNAIRFLQSHGIRNIPQPICNDDLLDLGIYKWISGDQIDIPSVKKVKQIIKFVQKLYVVSKSFKIEYIENATEACLSADAIVVQVEQRLQKLLDVSFNNVDLHMFLKDRFEPLWHKVLEQCYDCWPHSSISNELNKEYQILSPSDLGFHNVIDHGDTMSFVDFEYFGWDDPVKLTADFLWHPAMHLDEVQSILWEESMIKLFDDDPDFVRRLHAAKPLYGMRWSMIVLKKFVEFSTIYTDAYNIEDQQIKEQLDLQLTKAQYYCDVVTESIQESLVI